MIWARSSGSAEAEEAVEEVAELLQHGPLGQVAWRERQFINLLNQLQSGTDDESTDAKPQHHEEVAKQHLNRLLRARRGLLTQAMQLAESKAATKPKSRKRKGKRATSK